MEWRLLAKPEGFRNRSVLLDDPNATGPRMDERAGKETTLFHRGGVMTWERSDNVSFFQLLDEAKGGDSRALGRLLENCVSYLNILATTQLDRRLRRRVNPSDLVQDTMFAAYRDFGDFKGTCEPEWIAWLRQILIHCLHRAVEVHLRAGKRDLRREIPLQSARVDQDRSALDFAGLIPADGTSPSHAVQAEERAVALANELAKLPQPYREVIVYRNLQGLSFDEIAGRMQRNVPAVRMLWLRAMDRFKLTCAPIE